MMLLTFHSLTQEMRMTQFKKLFLTPEHAPKDPTPFNRLVLARIDLMAAYMVTHNEEMAPDLPEDVRVSCLPAPSRRRSQLTSLCHSSSAQITASSRSSALRARQQHHALIPTFFNAVHSDGDTDYIAHLFDGIADSSEASAEPLKLTTYNSCLETVDGCRRRIRSAPR